MNWNIAAESISAVILCIIWVYSRQSHYLPTDKNRLFQACFMMTFLAMLSNILSTVFIQYLNEVPLWLNWTVTTIYFAATPLMGAVYFAYSIATIEEGRQRRSKSLRLLMVIPAALYFVMVLANIQNHWLFSLKPGNEYTQGPFIMVTYLVFYFYCLACCAVVLVSGSRIDRVIRNILIVFPIIAGLVIVIQLFIPNVILTGSAATCALLIIYLYLQNKQISIDYLLGIPNRKEFLKTLELQLSSRKDMPFDVVVLSLRGFKQVNDTYGQNTGDEFLKVIAGKVKELVKPYQLYRFSGDELAIVVENRDGVWLEHLVERLADRMDQPWQVSNFKCVIGAAVGVVHYPEAAGSMENIINAIEYSISYAKTRREGNICYCKPEMLDKVKRRNQVIQIIENAIDEDGFEVYYQPIWSVGQKRFTMCESLLRLPQSPLGPLYPSEFIPLAEETGLIVEMTYMVLHKVCRFVRQLLELGVDLECITVNFSSVQFTQSRLEEKVIDIIDRYQIPYHKIKIEITESVMVDNPETVERFINGMHEKGIQIGLDDFGTGYCNLVSVMSMPLDVIKIDKSLLWEALKNEKSAIMMRNITRVVQELGMRVVSEGVETREQEAFVEECGCDWIQGFLYAKPMRFSDAQAVMLSKNGVGSDGGL